MLEVHRASQRFAPEAGGSILRRWSCSRSAQRGGGNGASRWLSCEHVEFATSAMRTSRHCAKCPDHHRRSLGPSIAPTSAQRTIGPPYQSAINGMEPPGWWKANTAAPNAPATSPIIAPVRARLVGAPLRRAQMSDANGAMANSGMQTRQAAHCGPKIIPPHAVGRLRMSATIPAESIAKNNSAKTIRGVRPGSPGRAARTRKLVPAATSPSVNAIATILRPKYSSPSTSAGAPKIASIRQSAAIPPTASAMTNVLRSCPPSTGSRLVPNTLMSSSVFMSSSCADKERQGSQSAMHRYLYGRLRHARSRRSFAHAQSVELDHLNGASRLGREPGHELVQIEPAIDRGGIVVSKQVWGLLDRHVFERPLCAPQIIHKPVARDRIDPRRQELRAIIRMPSRVKSDQSLLEKVFRIGRALADP